MSKFHIDNNGDPGKCQSTKGQCPFGDDDSHFTSFDSARNHYEETMAASKVPGFRMTQADRRMSLTILRGNGDILTEGSSHFVAGALEPGKYMGTYRAKSTGDILIKVEITENNDLYYVKTSEFEKFDNKTMKKTLDVYSELMGKLRTMNTRQDYCDRFNLDRKIIIDAVNEADAIVDRYDDLENPEQLHDLRAELENLYAGFMGRRIDATNSENIPAENTYRALNEIFSSSYKLMYR